MFICKIKRKTDLEIFFQSAELEEIARTMHQSAGGRPTMGEAYHWEARQGAVYEATLVDGQIVRGALIKKAGTTGSTFNVWAGACDRFRAAALDADGNRLADFDYTRLDRGVNVSLFPLLCHKLATGLVFVNTEPMGAEQVKRYAQRMEKVVELIVGSVRPIEITVSIARKAPAVPAPREG